ncbi:hypothetical protein [Brevundimonas poindexterae]|uniref:hypothetical protein n=1 Tax=Brevundimonas poindexterae TaxID=74325 RepID=UPI001CFF3282|nr:hypothetical protein [Brevundimonas poindexterae]
MRRLGVLLLLGLLTPGCAAISDWRDHRRASTASCVWSADGSQVSITGPTDARMLNCLLRRETAPDTLQINSLGGNVEYALAIAERLAPAAPRVVVDGNCSSSCANYFLPIARQIVLLPDALILLHGSADPALLARFERDGTRSEGFRRLADRQARFVAAEGIAPGWLLYRTGEEGDPAWGAYVSGSPDGDGTTGRYLLVGEEFLRTCLPTIPVDGFADSVAGKVARDPALKARLARQGVMPTGTMQCIEGPLP